MYGSIRFGGEGAKEGNIAVFKFRAREKGLTTFSMDGEFFGENRQLLEADFKQTQVIIGKDKSNLQKLEQEQPTNQVPTLEEDNANLQVLRLDVEGMVPQFDKELQDYYLNIPNTIQNLEVLAISENSNAIVEITGNTDLKDGLNDIIIEVTSADKSQSKRYTIHVTKTANLELANTNLEILAVENVLLNPPFDTTITFYKVEVPNEQGSLNIFAVPENEKASVEINGKENLQEGNNLVTITVTASNGFTKRVYQLEAYRRNLEEEKAYQEEQLKRKENLENAYKIEQTSRDINDFQKDVTNNQNRKYYGILVLSIIIGVIILGLVVVVWRKKKKL